MEEQCAQIALLHARDEDRQQLSQLLSNESFDLMDYDDCRSLADDRIERGTMSAYSNSTFAVLLWARVDAPDDGRGDAPDDGMTNNDSLPHYRITDELEQLKGRIRRIVVLTDSMDETTVCTYLAAGAHHVIAIDDTPRLLQARLLAGLREHAEPTTDDWQIGPYQFDLARRVVKMEGRPLGLSPREFEFARFLFEHSERIVPIAELMQSVWSLPATEDARRIDTAACRLRKKMMLNGNSAWHLRRIRQDGYQLTQIGETL